MIARKPAWTIVLYATVLAAVWYALSGRFDLLHFGTGVATAVIIAMRARNAGDGTTFQLGRFLRFLPWLAGQVLLSNLRVARIVLSPSMPIRPTLIRMPPGVSGVRALAMLGTSTTLTPGTLTVDVEQDETLVHALDRRSVDDVRGGVMARRVARVFGPDAS